MEHLRDELYPGCQLGSGLFVSRLVGISDVLSLLSKRPRDFRLAPSLLQKALLFDLPIQRVARLSMIGSQDRPAVAVPQSCKEIALILPKLPLDARACQWLELPTELARNRIELHSLGCD